MPDPAVPPTPPVLLTSLLAREDLSLRRIAGPEDPGTVVHWVHTSEMADPYPYLLGGELLLTAGVHIPEAAGSGTYFDEYVSRIVAAGGAALGFGVAPVHDTVPRALVAACETHGLPLLEVPPQTTFSGVARAVWQLMAQSRLAELRRVTDAQQSLASAASRPDPVPSVLRQLAQRLGGWAVLYGPEGAEIAGAGRRPGEEVRAALTRLARVVRPDGPAPPTGATPPTDSTPRTGATGTRPTEPGTAGPPNHPAPPTGATPPTDSTPRTGATGTRPTEPGTAGPPDRPAPPTGSTPRAGAARSGETRAARAAAFLRPDAGGAPASQTDPGRPVPTSATDTAAGTHLAAYALGAGHGFVLGVASPQRAPGDHTVVSVAAVLLSLLTGEQQSGTGAARSSALVRLLLGAAPEEVAPLLGGGRWVVVRARPDGTGPADPVAASALGAALGSALVDPAGDVVRVLVPAGRTPAPLPGWTLGVSAAVAPHDWPTADTQAARALARARATRTPLLRHGPRPALADLVPPGEAAAHAHALLAPVAAHPALTETLRTWLSLHGSWDRTAVALSVHRNTVRQRVTRCATLLETDLDDPDVRMELWFALRRL
ncbi:PucR family transcriptional regulator ligand-binding domain-containing protein [Streptomyces violaceochromogenes]|uniref:PucR family transcriptional regulator ligand-binding domain-containing protein n=2 Tax=Streptomyces TaxID=1883 RepID=A0ABU6LXS8_9ACTN|nr:PucR family transcriptional regulator ligand-binding domain-containing protein [Streptomyces violaceochromogenes]